MPTIPEYGAPTRALSTADQFAAWQDGKQVAPTLADLLAFTAAGVDAKFDELEAPLIATLNAGVSSAAASASSAAASAARLSPLITPPAGDSYLTRLGTPRWFSNAIDGTPIIIPALIGLAQFARLSSGAFRCRFAGYASAGAAPVYFAYENPDAGTLLDTEALSGEQQIALYAIDASTGAQAGEQIGVVPVEIDGVFGPWATEIPYSAGGIKRNATLADAAMIATIDARIELASKTESRRDQGPWLPSVRNPYLRDLITDFAMEEGDAQGRYGLTMLETRRYNLGGGVSFDRVRITVHDFWLGIDCCQQTLQSAAGTTLVDTNMLPDRMWISQGELPQWFGGQAYLEFDWSKVDWTYGPKTFTTWAEAGFLQSRTATTEIMDAEFGYGRSNPVVELYVRDTGGDFTSMDAAIRSLLRTDIGTVDGSAQPISWKCGFSHQVKIWDMRDAELEIMTGPFLPDYLTIEVPSRGVIYTAAAGKRIFEANGSYRHIGVNFGQPLDAYAEHSDENNQRSRPATIGPAIQRWHNRQAEEFCSYVLDPGQSEWGRGAGFSSGSRTTIAYPICDRRGSATNAFFGFHDLPGSVEAGILRIIGLKATVNPGGGAEVALLAEFPTGLLHKVIIEDADGTGVLVAAAATAIPDNYGSMPTRARERVSWDIRVIGDGGAVTVDISDPKMRVLGTTPGLAVGGEGAALLGRYDQTKGRWDGLTLDGSIRSLANRFGDCRTAPKPITAAGQTWPGNGDYRGLSETAILASINASLTGNPIVTVRIDGEILS